MGLLTRLSVHPRLIFLAACQSATRSSTDAFLGLAPKLVSVGVPAVIAMQNFVSVETARKFGGLFYQRLLGRGRVDEAMNEARSALLTAGRLDVAVPVLFMRLKSGLLWSAEADARGKVLGVPNPRAIWNDLIEKITKGKCTPIIGPRVHGTWLPTAEDVAHYWAEQYGYPFAGREKNMARVAQYLATITLKEYHPHRQWLDILMNQFVNRLPEDLRPKQEYETLSELVQTIGFARLAADDPNEPHRVLASLKLPMYLTTNCDNFMAEALAAQSIIPIQEICRWNKELDGLPSQFDGEVPFDGKGGYIPTRESPLVYHLFGRDVDLKSLVLTEDNYLDFLIHIGEKGRIPDYIRGKLGSTSLMLIGYSLHDLEFRILMRGLVANVERQFAYQDVAVQLEGVNEADVGAVQDFLRKYFERANINVFWGGSAQFIAELREHWEVDRR